MLLADRMPAHVSSPRPLAASLAAAFMLAAPVAALAMNHVVANCQDNVPGSLRATVGSALDMDTVDLSQVAPCTITLTNGAIAIGVNNLTLTAGSGSRNAVTIDGGLSAGYHNRVFTHTKFGTLSIEGLKITDAKYNSGAAVDFKGGCIASMGSVRLVGSTVSGCEVYDLLGADVGVYGGGISAESVYLSGSAVTKNTAHATSTHFASGGGIYARHVTLVHSIVSGNSVVAESGRRAMGGGVAATNDVDVSYSTISANQAQIDGGIHLYASFSPYSDYSEYFARISNSTISGNSSSDNAMGSGGMSLNVPLTLSNSTIAFNSTHSNIAAGLYVTCPYSTGHYSCVAPQLQSSIIAGNGDFTDFGVGYGVPMITGSANNLIYSSLVSLPTGNLRGVCPRLQPLADNGGSMPTHALMHDSPAINAGNNVGTYSYDERGPAYPRVFGVQADIGAFERQGGPDDRVFHSGVEEGCDE
jgi:hypothetical protein